MHNDEPTPSEILRNARATLDDPDHWTKGGLAYNAEREPRYTNSEDATTFCAFGAICHHVGVRAATDTQGMELMTDNGKHAVRALSEAVTGYAQERFKVAAANVIVYNDGKTKHDDIVNAFDKAIAKLPQAQR